MGLPARLDAALPADQLAQELAGAANSGEARRARPLIAQLTQMLVRAVQYRPDIEVDDGADRLTATAATLAVAAPGTYEATMAIDGHHDAFEEILQVRDLPGQRARLDLYRVLRPNVLALGGLFVRLRDWEAIRRLVTHQSPPLGGHPRSWLLFMDAEQFEASPQRNAEGRAHPIRAAREATMRVAALRPDHVDEHQALDSILAFDLVANLIEGDMATRDGYELEVWPAFTAFDERGVRSVAQRLLRDADMRQGLLPGRDLCGVATLLSTLDAESRANAPETRSWGGLLSAESAGQVAQLLARAGR